MTAQVNTTTATAMLNGGYDDGALPMGVMGCYAALAIWVGLLVQSIRQPKQKTNNFQAFFWFGVIFMVYLNTGYFINDVPQSIAQFVGIYDTLINLGIDNHTGTMTAAAMKACRDNNCSAWGDRYEYHSAWAVAFYERFAFGPSIRSTVLYGHIFFNSLALILSQIQFLYTGYALNNNKRRQHQALGYLTLVFVTISLGCACYLASEHGQVEEYGGPWSEYGFYSMAACVYACILMGVRAIRRGDHNAHKVWMYRYAGSMWGSFWLFRAMLVVIDPLLREIASAAILICIWFSAPLGVLLGDYARTRGGSHDSTLHHQEQKKQKMV